MAGNIGIFVQSAMRIVAAALIFLVITGASIADTKKVDVKVNKPQWIDGIAAYSNSNCGSLVAVPKIKVEPEHGRLELKNVPQEIKEGRCRGKTIKVLGIGYYPKRGYKGPDKATISWRQPRGDYYIG